MGYKHIDNLYKDQSILQFKRCYALEKIDGTSAHIAWRTSEGIDTLRLSPGGMPCRLFRSLFNEQEMRDRFKSLGHDYICVYGEAYGGKQQGLAKRYGDQPRFIAFEVQVGKEWLCVPDAERIARRLGLEFVHYVEVDTDVAALDEQRDAPSVQAERNGMGHQPREGVVLRPIIEFLMPNGSRIVAKHKRAEDCETATPRAVIDPTRQALLADADAIANEWVTQNRLRHVLDKIPTVLNMAATRSVIDAMIEDVLREARGEIVVSDAARKAIGTRTATLFAKYLKGL